MPLTPKRETCLLILSIAIFAGLISGCATREEKIASAREKAAEAFADSKQDKAVKILNSAIEDFPDDTSLLITAANLHRQLGNAKEAIAALEKAIEIDTSKQGLWVNIGDLKARSGDTAGAIQAYDYYLAERPDDFLAWKTLSELEKESGDNKRAIDAALKWNDLRPSARPALELGDLFLASDNFPQARSWYSQASAYEDQTDAKFAYRKLIELEAQLRQYLQAERLIADYERKYGNSDSAIDPAKQLVQRWRDAQEEIAKTAKLLEEQRAKLEAEREEAARPKIIVNRAANAEGNADETTQNESTETVNTTGPIERAPTPLADDGNDDGEEEESGATEIADADGIDIEQIEGTLEERIAQYSNLLGEQPGNALLWQKLAEAYIEQEKWFDAEACALEAKRFNPRSAKIASLYLQVSIQTQSAQAAVEESRSMKTLFPRNPEIALLAAQALVKAGATDALIRSAYEDFMSLADPSTPGYEEASRYARPR